MTNAPAAPTALADLGLTAKTAERADAGGCGGGCNCTCGAYDAAEENAEEGTGEATAESTPVDATPVDGPVSAEYSVAGMTCAHCVASVSEEVSEIAGVLTVAVDLAVGGLSTVTITSSAPLDAAAVQAAVTEAGYELATA